MQAHKGSVIVQSRDGHVLLWKIDDAMSDEEYDILAGATDAIAGVVAETGGVASFPHPTDADKRQAT